MTEPSQRPPIASAPISVILFAHALSTETADALNGWRSYLETLRRPYEILLIQETRPEAPAESEASIRTFPYERSLGYRAAFNDAVRATQYPLVAFATCDKQYQPADLERLLKSIDQVDLVIGYRAGGQAPPWRVLLDLFVIVFSRIVIGLPLEPRTCWLGSDGRGRRWVARWIFGVNVRDPECPFRLARREVFQRVPIQSSGPFAQVEILAKANHLTCMMMEEPVTWTPPALPVNDAIGFGSDAWMVFRDPDFGPAVGAPLAG